MAENFQHIDEVHRKIHSIIPKSTEASTKTSFIVRPVSPVCCDVWLQDGTSRTTIAFF